MENFSEINKKINALVEKSKNMDDYKTFKLFEEIANDIWPKIYNGTMSITFNFFSLVLSFLSIGFENKDLLNNRWKSRTHLTNLNVKYPHQQHWIMKKKHSHLSWKMKIKQ